MLTVISRIIHYGFKNFWRNGWLSTVTVALMVLALLVFGGLIMFRTVAHEAAMSIQDKIDISVYFKTNTGEDQILEIKQSLETLSEVKEVEYISRDTALAAFKEAHANDPVISQGINELGSNPLEASLNIKANQPDQYAAINDYLHAPNILSLIDGEPSYHKNQVVIDRLTSIVNNITRGGLALTIFLAIIAGLVVFNTIRLAIYSNREEIGVMRVVGASNSFVRGPSMIEGMLSGFLAAVFSLALMAPVVYFASPHLESFIPGLNLFAYFYTNLAWLFLYQLAFGVGIGVVSSFIAVRRYLKN